MRLTALLNTHSYFSFGTACSSPSTLVKQAAELGYRHIALTDTLGVYGMVELIEACKETGLKPILGSTLKLDYEGAVYPLVLLASSKRGYQTLNDLISLAKLNEDELITLSTLEAHTTDLHVLTGGRKGFLNQLIGQKKISKAEYLLKALKSSFQNRLWVQLFYDCYPWDMRRARVLRAFAHAHGVATVAVPEIRYVTPDLMPLYDTLLCGRLGITLGTPHKDRPLNNCQAIYDASQFPIPYEDAVENANQLAELLCFELLPDRLTPPPATVPDGYDADSYLESLCR